MVFIPEMNDNFLKVLHFYGLHQIKSQSSLNKNSGFCALGIINPSLRKYSYFFRLAILSSAIWIIRLTISPPTFPLSRAVVSAPSLTSNSLAISVFIWSTALSTPGTNNSLRLLFSPISDHFSLVGLNRIFLFMCIICNRQTIKHDKCWKRRCYY